jgi:hypothetical protein
MPFAKPNGTRLSDVVCNSPLEERLLYMAAKTLKEIIDERIFRSAAEKMAFAFGWNAAMDIKDGLQNRGATAGC